MPACHLPARPSCCQVAEISPLPDPCPLPSAIKKRSLNERERLIYAVSGGERELAFRWLLARGTRPSAPPAPLSYSGRRRRRRSVALTCRCKTLGRWQHVGRAERAEHAERAVRPPAGACTPPLPQPMSDVGGLMFDKDAVYIDIPDWKVSTLFKHGNI